MWGQLLLCSSLFRNLIKSHYCASYFFLLLITLYFISSYTAAVAGSCPTLVLLKRENNAKRGCPRREIMPCPSCSHMQDRFIFFQAQQPVGNVTVIHALGNTPFLVLSSGISPEWAHQWSVVGCRVWHHQSWDTCTYPHGVMKFEEKGQFLPPCPDWSWTVSDRWRGTCTESQQVLASSFVVLLLAV